MKALKTHTLIAIQQPHLWFISIVGIISLILTSLWVSYEYGRYVAGYDRSEAVTAIGMLEAKLEISQSKIIETKRQATMLERNSRIDDDASVQLKDTLAQTQTEVLELKKELSFYKSIVAPEQGGRSVAIQTVKLTKNEQGNFDYKVMVSQRGRNDKFIRGVLEVSIEGVKKGQPLTLKLAEVSNETKKSMKFGFKYFQNFEGVITLPKAFSPDIVHVKVKPSTGKVKTVNEQFVWSDLTADGA